MTKKLFVRTEQYDELQNKYSNLLTTLNAERHEEIKSWMRRQDLIKRTIEEVKHQLEDTRNRRDASLLMKDEEHRLLADEVKLLRSESNKLQAFWENQFNEWVAEKSTLKEEIDALRNSLGTAEKYYQDATDMREKERALLRDNTEFLKQKEDYYIKLANDKVETERQLREIRDKDKNFKQQKTEKLTETLRTQADRAFKAAENAKKHQDNYETELRTDYEQQIEQLQESQGVLTYQNDQLSKQIKDMSSSHKDIEAQM